MKGKKSGKAPVETHLQHKPTLLAPPASLPPTSPQPGMTEHPPSPPSLCSPPQCPYGLPRARGSSRAPNAPRLLLGSNSEPVLGRCCFSRLCAAGSALPRVGMVERERFVERDSPASERSGKSWLSRVSWGFGNWAFRQPKIVSPAIFHFQ